MSWVTQSSAAIDDVNESERVERFLNATKLERINVRNYNGNQLTKDKSFQDFGQMSRRWV